MREGEVAAEGRADLVPRAGPPCPLYPSPRPMGMGGEKAAGLETDDPVVGNRRASTVQWGSWALTGPNEALARSG